MMVSDTDWQRALEEYKLSQESRHHHEKTMWQLLGFYLAVTGILLQFWLNADPFTERAAESNSFLVLGIPLLLGVFTGGALIKHRFFWRQELLRARELERILGFERESAFTKPYYSSPIRYVRSWHLAVASVIATVAGMAYLIGRSLWFKPQTLLGGYHWFPLYVLIILLFSGVYVLGRKFQVNKERSQDRQGTEIPEYGSRFFWWFWATYLTGGVLLVAGSLSFWWSLEISSRAASLGQSFFDVWLSTIYFRAAVLSFVIVGAMLLIWILWLDKRLISA